MTSTALKRRPAPTSSARTGSKPTGSKTGNSKLQWLGTRSVAVTPIAIYVALMPLIVGLPRGALLPLLRPSEVLQLVVTAAAMVGVAIAVLDGSRWKLRLSSVDRWLLAVVAAGSVLPLLWLMGRGLPLTLDHILSAFPLVKYAALYFLVRACVRRPAQLALVVKATTGASLVIATIAVAQALEVGPVIDVLGKYFVSSAEDVVDGGRATTTFGSAIATGAYLVISCGLAISHAIPTGSKRWYAAAAWLAFGAFASGQIGTLLALAVILIMVAYFNKSLTKILPWVLPGGAIVAIVLWPIVMARLADLDQGSNLPKSWLARWNNLAELFWPPLAEGGWVLGVSPDATLPPPEVWREIVYLESGYLWMLWVGGVPLIFAVLGFFASIWRELKPTQHSNADVSVKAVAVTGRAAVAMIALLSVIDAHLTLRASADLFFILVSMAMIGHRLTVPLPKMAQLWHNQMGTALEPVLSGVSRIQLGEANSSRGLVLPSAFQFEQQLTLTVSDPDKKEVSVQLTLARRKTHLYAFLDSNSIDGPINSITAAMIWRNVAIVAGSLRVKKLHVVSESEVEYTASAKELVRAYKLAQSVETKRSKRPTADVLRSEVDEGKLPRVRIEKVDRIPRWKRFSDIVLGSVVLLLTAPIWAACYVAVKLSGPGPVFYRQLRIGAGGIPFQIYKFRSMSVGNDDAEHREINRQELAGEAPGTKDANDVRVTAAGRWLRRLSLDELPQLLNVLRGEMSLVGPRPSLLWEVEMFQPHTRRRLQARPGMTGLWQIGGRADVSMLEMLELDLDYVNRMGPLLDLRCLFGTARSVIQGKGAR